jgi:hypothetical protein
MVVVPEIPNFSRQFTVLRQYVGQPVKVRNRSAALTRTDGVVPLRIPILSGRVFRREAGRHSDLEPATLDEPTTAIGAIGLSRMPVTGVDSVALASAPVDYASRPNVGFHGLAAFKELR